MRGQMIPLWHSAWKEWGSVADLWSISAALARGFSDRHFERGEVPGDEVEDVEHPKPIRTLYTSAVASQISAQQNQSPHYQHQLWQLAIELRNKQTISDESFPILL